MNMKSFFLGLLAGIVLSLVVLTVYGHYVGQAANSGVHYFEQAQRYENKSLVTLEVFQVYSDGALAIDKTNNSYDIKAVMIIGENYYTGQIVTINNPQIIGTYSYTANNGTPMTVPIIDGEY